MTSTITPTGHGLGCIRDTGDIRDHHLFIQRRADQPLPPSVDLRANCPPVYDQGQLGSCTANAIAGALEFDQIKQLFRPYVPSRLFVYYNERVIEHSVPYDSGATIRDSCKAVARYGYADEVDWPYDIARFTIKPPTSIYQQALPLHGIVYQRVLQDLTQLKLVLAQDYVIVIGISVYESFESNAVATTGMVPMPAPSEQLLGGHAVCLVGYSTNDKYFTCRNSWGQNWGDKGHFYLPEEYLAHPDLSSDFWVIQHVLG